MYGILVAPQRPQKTYLGGDISVRAHKGVVSFVHLHERVAVSFPLLNNVVGRGVRETSACNLSTGIIYASNF